MLVVTKKVGGALWINGATVGVISVRGNRVQLGIQGDDHTKLCDLRLTSPMPQPKSGPSPDEVERANRDLVPQVNELN
jgi:hypothetical protein